MGNVRPTLPSTRVAGPHRGPLSNEEAAGEGPLRGPLRRLRLIGWPLANDPGRGSGWGGVVRSGAIVSGPRIARAAAPRRVGINGRQHAEQGRPAARAGGPTTPPNPRDRPGPLKPSMYRSRILRIRHAHRTAAPKRPCVAATPRRTPHHSFGRLAPNSPGPRNHPDSQARRSR
jgi:hypothetical protein